jgi:hypothetical protein
LSLGADKRFYSWDATDRPEAVDSLSQRWVFSLAFIFPPIPLLKRVAKKLETSKGTFLIVTPFWEAQTWFASLLTLKVEDIRRLPLRDDLSIDLSTESPPPVLERLHLVVWKITGGAGASLPFQTKPLVSSRQGGDPPQWIAMNKLGRPSSYFYVLPPFHSIRRL